MSDLRTQARAAYEAVVNEATSKEKKALAAQQRKATRERNARIKRNEWLLESSALLRLFPGVHFVIVDAVDAGKGPNPTPFIGRGQIIDLPAALLVREKNADGLFIPTFRISRKDKEEVVIVGEQHSVYASTEIWQRPVECLVTTPADVGRWLKNKRDDMDRAYRENPD